MASQIVRPNGDGDDTGEGAIPVGAATLWEAVDESSPDDNTTYVEGQDTNFTIPAFTVPSGATINFLRVHFRGGWGFSQKGAVKIGSTWYVADETGTWAFSSSYANAYGDWTVNPATSSAWTVTEINSIAQIGFTADNGANRTTQIYAEVNYTEAGAFTGPTQSVYPDSLTPQTKVVNY